MELEQQRPALRRQGLAVAAISYDSPAILQEFAQRLKISYPLLSDAGSKTITAFGLLNTTVPENSFVRGVPYPGTFLVSPAGLVQSKFFEPDFRERYTIGSVLLTRFNAGGREVARTTTKHLTADITVANTRVAPGQRVALAIDVKLRPKMHVYAPGVRGYIPISLQLGPSAGFRVEPVQWPTARSLRLPAIQETVPVYTGQFRIVQEITVAQPGEVTGARNIDGKLPLQGTLHYQACDDKICYQPQTIPFSVPLDFAELDRTRASAPIRHQ